LSSDDDAVPVWVWIIVTVATGIGSGLFGTLITVRHERGRDLRRRSLEVVEEIAGQCDDWFQIMQTAINARWEDVYETDRSNAAFKAAEEAVAGARRDLNRMHALLPPKSHTSLHAYGMVGALEEALEALREWPPEADEVDDEEEYDADWSGDEMDYHPVFTPMTEAIDEATMWRTLGLQQFGDFIDIAPVELRGGFWPAAARALGLPAKGSRKILRAVRRRQGERRHRRLLKELAARQAELERGDVVR
jgi:hypothetical protein